VITAKIITMFPISRNIFLFAQNACYRFSFLDEVNLPNVKGKKEIFKFIIYNILHFYYLR